MLKKYTIAILFILAIALVFLLLKKPISADVPVLAPSLAPTPIITGDKPAAWCSGSRAVPSDALTITQLENLTYAHDQNHKTTLINGEGRFSIPGIGMASLYLVEECTTYGDLNGDGRNDAVVVLGQHADDTTGSWYQLVAVLNQNGKPTPVAYSDSSDLGDRPIIQKIAIQDGTIKTASTVQGPDDPSCCPNLTKTFTYKLRDNKLILQ